MIGSGSGVALCDRRRSFCSEGTFFLLRSHDSSFCRTNYSITNKQFNCRPLIPKKEQSKQITTFFTAHHRSSFHHSSSIFGHGRKWFGPKPAMTKDISINVFICVFHLFKDVKPLVTHQEDEYVRLSKGSLCTFIPDKDILFYRKIKSLSFQMSCKFSGTGLVWTKHVSYIMKFDFVKLAVRIKRASHRSRFQDDTLLRPVRNVISVFLSLVMWILRNG